MSRIYDNWERLVAATLKKEQLWQLFHAPSRSISSRESDSSLSSSFSDLHLDFEPDNGTWTEAGLIFVTTIGGKNDQPKQTIRYMKERIVGTGSFGIVFEAKCIETGETVAIKKVLQDKRYKNRESQTMRLLDHPNVVSLKHCFSTTDKDELYLNLVLEYVPETVYRVVRHYNKANQLMPLIYAKLYTYQIYGYPANSKPKGKRNNGNEKFQKSTNNARYSSHMVQNVTANSANSMVVTGAYTNYDQSSMSQIFRALAYIHGIGVCHRDIKPQNLLVDPHTHLLKLCDFGSAKILVKGEPNVSYICSRYYRAPELIFGATEYTSAIDIWSVGCVLAELLLGQVLGAPTHEEIKCMNPNYTLFKFPRIKAHPWYKLEACTHPFFDEIRDPNVRFPNGRPLPPLFNFQPPELEGASLELLHKLIPEHARKQFPSLVS
ncbi:hypothetical protein BUALT_Bualt16G0014400 [Buddleja alternifolia]|uniref:non-specific serine/threonine protein kinase n=1 Tax=Buddleja alternifolia TaxID=168488 RepID=A0AAV6W8E5_9LAMI|nr:hypothetical protein BUALT_Bualt16G0014400 [Buddleja alternifolia]